MIVSPLYAIVDAEVLRARGVALREFVEALRAAGVGTLQYRDKVGTPQEVLRGAEVIREVMAGAGCRLILNDRADLAVLAEFDGVHVGQDDLSPEDARRVLGAGKVVGVSTHTPEHVRAAELSCADYVAVGPVFATGSKLDASAVIGLEGVRRMRELTTKPVVAIGGITLGNARSVMEAGADSVAVIGGLLGESVEVAAREFLRIAGGVGVARPSRCVS